MCHRRCPSKYADIVVAVIGSDDVGFAVAVQVRHRKSVGPGTDGELTRWQEGAVRCPEARRRRSALK